jgi:hypothetical protein
MVLEVADASRARLISGGKVTLRDGDWPWQATLLRRWQSIGFTAGSVKEILPAPI